MSMRCFCAFFVLFPCFEAFLAGMGKAGKRWYFNVFQPSPARGARGIRTPDPLHAMEMRYQLRHSPEEQLTTIHGPWNFASFRPVAAGRQ